MDVVSILCKSIILH